MTRKSPPQTILLVRIITETGEKPNGCEYHEEDVTETLGTGIFRHFSKLKTIVGVNESIDGHGAFGLTSNQ